MGCGVWGVGCGVWGLGCEVLELGFGAWYLGFKVWGLGLKVWGLGCGVWGLAIGVDLRLVPPDRARNCASGRTPVSRGYWSNTGQMQRQTGLFLSTHPPLQTRPEIVRRGERLRPADTCQVMVKQESPLSDTGQMRRHFLTLKPFFSARARPRASGRTPVI